MMRQGIRSAVVNKGDARGGASAVQRKYKGFLTAEDIDKDDMLLTTNRICFILLVLYIMIGIAFYTLTHGIDPLTTIYFSITTLMTIGYGDFDTIDHGFASFFVIFGAGAVGTFIGIVAVNLMEENEARWSKALSALADDMVKMDIKFDVWDILGIDPNEVYSDGPTGNSHKANRSIKRRTAEYGEDEEDDYNRAQIQNPDRSPSAMSEAERGVGRGRGYTDLGGNTYYHDHDWDEVQNPMYGNAGGQYPHGINQGGVIIDPQALRARKEAELRRMDLMNQAVYDKEMEDLYMSGGVNFLLVLFLIFLGACAMSGLEKWNLTDSVYWSCVTITTTGFGDISPKTDGGKIFTIFYAFFGCVLCVRAFSEVIRFPVTLKQKDTEIEVSKQFYRGLSEQAMMAAINHELFEIIPKLKQDTEGVAIQKSEFVLAMLSMMGKIHDKDVILAAKIFDRMDDRNEGYMTTDEWEAESVRARERDRYRQMHPRKRKGFLLRTLLWMEACMEGLFLDEDEVQRPSSVQSSYHASENDDEDGGDAGVVYGQAQGQSQRQGQGQGQRQGQGQGVAARARGGPAVSRNMRNTWPQHQQQQQQQGGVGYVEGDVDGDGDYGEGYEDAYGMQGQNNWQGEEYYGEEGEGQYEYPQEPVTNDPAVGAGGQNTNNNNINDNNNFSWLETTSPDADEASSAGASSDDDDENNQTTQQQRQQQSQPQQGRGGGGGGGARAGVGAGVAGRGGGRVGAIAAPSTSSTLTRSPLDPSDSYYLSPDTTPIPTRRAVMGASRPGQTAATGVPENPFAEDEDDRPAQMTASTSAGVGVATARGLSRQPVVSMLPQQRQQGQGQGTGGVSSGRGATGYQRNNNNNNDEFWEDIAY